MAHQMGAHSVVHRLASTAVFLTITLAAGIFACSVYHAVDKPFSLDETDVALRAHLINHEGIFPRGFVTGEAEALTHPPMYEFVLALVFRLAGETEAAARGFGVLCYLAILLLSWLTLRCLTHDMFQPARSFTSVIFLSVCLLNPLMIQHAMLIDADTTGTALCAAIFGYLFVRSESWTGRSYLMSRAALAAVTALMLLFKEAIPFMLMGGVAVYRLANRDFRRLLIDLILIIGVGAFIAWTAWSLYANGLGMDPMRIYASQDSARYSRITNLDFALKILRALPTITRWPVYWNSAPLIALIALAIGARAVRWVKIRRLEPVDALVLSALAVWVPFLLVKPSIDMMKYQYPVYPMLFVAGGYVLAERIACAHDRSGRLLSAPRGRAEWICLAVAVTIFAALLWHYHSLGDYILKLFTRSHRPAWRQFLMEYYLPIIIVAGGAVVAGFGRKKVFNNCVIALMLSVFPIQIALNLRQIGDYTTVESWMNYGEKGLREVSSYLAERTRPGAITCFRKDIRYYVERRHGVWLSKNLDPRYIFMTPDKDLEAFDRFLASAGPDHIVTDPVSLLRIPDKKIQQVESVIRRYYEPDRVYGVFKIYRKRSAGQS